MQDFTVDAKIVSERKLLKEGRGVVKIIASTILFVFGMFMVFYSIDYAVAAMTKQPVLSVKNELLRIATSVPAWVVIVLSWRKIMGKRSLS